MLLIDGHHEYVYISKKRQGRGGGKGAARWCMRAKDDEMRFESRTASLPLMVDGA